MAEKEDIHNIPLRKEWLKAPEYRRAKKAIVGIRKYMEKHYRNQEIKIGKYLNLEIWGRGNRNPPPYVTVKVIKDKDFIRVELPNAPVEEVAKKEEKKGLLGKLKEKVTTKEKDKKEDIKKEEDKLAKKEEKTLDKKFLNKQSMPKEKSAVQNPKREAIEPKHFKKGPIKG